MMQRRRCAVCGRARPLPSEEVASVAASSSAAAAAAAESAAASSTCAECVANAHAERILRPRLTALSTFVDAARHRLFCGKGGSEGAEQQQQQETAAVLLAIRAPPPQRSLFSTAHLRMLRVTASEVVRLTADGSEERGRRPLAALRRVVVDVDVPSSSSSSSSSESDGGDGAAAAVVGLLLVYGDGGACEELTTVYGALWTLLRGVWALRRAAAGVVEVLYLPELCGRSPTSPALSPEEYAGLLVRRLRCGRGDARLTLAAAAALSENEAAWPRLLRLAVSELGSCARTAEAMRGLVLGLARQTDPAVLAAGFRELRECCDDVALMALMAFVSVSESCTPESILLSGGAETLAWLLKFVRLQTLPDGAAATALCALERILLGAYVDLVENEDAIHTLTSFRWELLSVCDAIAAGVRTPAHESFVSWSERINALRAAAIARRLRDALVASGHPEAAHHGDSPQTPTIFAQPRVHMQLQVSSVVHEDAEHVRVLHDSGVAEVLNDGMCMATLVADVGVSSRGRWCFEVVIGTPGSIRVGWTTTATAAEACLGIGEDGLSWAYDGARRLRIHKRKEGSEPTEQRYGAHWNPGNSVRCIIDLDDGKISFFCDEVWLGVAFTLPQSVRASSTFRPAISLASQQFCAVNLGSRPFAHFIPQGAAAIEDALNEPDPPSLQITPSVAEESSPQGTPSTPSRLSRFLQGTSECKLCFRAFASVTLLPCRCTLCSECAKECCALCPFCHAAVAGMQQANPHQHLAVSPIASTANVSAIAQAPAPASPSEDDNDDVRVHLDRNR